MATNGALSLHQLQEQLAHFFDTLEPVPERARAARIFQSQLLTLSAEQKQRLLLQLEAEVQGMLRTLDDPDQETLLRRLAASVLGNLGALDALTLFMDLALDPKNPTALRRQVLWSVQQLLPLYPDEVLDFPFPLMLDVAWNEYEDTGVRALAIQLLAYMERVRAIPSLQQLLLRTHQTRLGIAAAEALGHTAENYYIPLAIDALLEGLEEGEWEAPYEVRTAIVQALEKLQAHESMSALIDAFTFPEDDDDEEAESIYACDQAILHALGSFRDSSAVPALLAIAEEALELLETMDPVRHSEPFAQVSGLIEQALAALRQIQDPDALPLLLRLLQHANRNISNSALHALRRFGSQARDAVPALRQMLSDPHTSDSTRKTAITTLAAIGPDAASALPDLIELLHHLEPGTEEPDTEEMSKEIVIALAQLHTPTDEVLVLLQEQLHHPASSVQIESCIALLRLFPSSLPALEIVLLALDDRLRSLTLYLEAKQDPTREPVPELDLSDWVETITHLQQAIHRHLALPMEPDSFAGLTEQLQHAMTVLEQASLTLQAPTTNALLAPLHEQFTALVVGIQQDALSTWRENWEDALFTGD